MTNPDGTAMTPLPNDHSRPPEWPAPTKETAMSRFLGSTSTHVLGVCLATVLFVPAANAARCTFCVLHTFTDGNDGASPSAGLIDDNQGNLYSTTQSGGAYGFGAVYELAPNGNETALWSFDDNGADGYKPLLGNLVMDKSGDLFGTTGSGGTGSCSEGCGTVFKLAPDGSETVLYSFAGGSDGEYPYYGVVEDKDGNLYGTTYGGGANSAGTVFKVTQNGTETALYSFCSQANCTDGLGPLSQLLIGKKGNLYGTTVSGGAGANERGGGGGTVFELSPPGKGQQIWTETVLYSFQNTPDAKIPYAGLIADKSGNFYGTTYDGGTGSCSEGCGTVFKLAPDTGQCSSTTGWCETVLYSFTGGTDGTYPHAALVEDKEGNLYGTTYQGGASGDGIVFELSPDTGQCTSGTGWCETVLYTFAGGNDGASPVAALHLKGNYLYGTAEDGGADGYGTVFKVRK